jgi:hypothetical protein
MWKHKRYQITKIILREIKSNAYGIIPDFKLYYKVIVAKQHGTGTNIDMKTNGTEDLEIKPQSYSHFIFDKGDKT